MEAANLTDLWQATDWLQKRRMEMQKRIYRVKANTRRGTAIGWAVDIEAHSQKAAIERAKAMWKEDAHPFNMQAKRIERGEFWVWTCLHEWKLIDGVWHEVRYA